jgi:hypothetical protein
MIENKNDYYSDPNYDICLDGFPYDSIHLMEVWGKIINAKQNCSTFIHNINTSDGNSGSPICNINSYLIGIHCGFTKINGDKTINFGIFFNYILEDTKKQYAKLIIEIKKIDIYYLVFYYKIYKLKYFDKYSADITSIKTFIFYSFNKFYLKEIDFENK